MTSGDKVVPGFILPVARPSPVSWLSRECVARQAEPRQIVPPEVGLLGVSHLSAQTQGPPLLDKIFGQSVIIFRLLRRDLWGRRPLLPTCSRTCSPETPSAPATTGHGLEVRRRSDPVPLRSSGAGPEGSTQFRGGALHTFVWSERRAGPGHRSSVRERRSRCRLTVREHT